MQQYAGTKNYRTFYNTRLEVIFEFIIYFIFIEMSVEDQHNISTT